MLLTSILLRILSGCSETKIIEYKNTKIMDENQTVDHDRILKINIEEEMKSSYIDLFNVGNSSSCTSRCTRWF